MKFRLLCLALILMGVALSGCQLVSVGSVTLNCKSFASTPFTFKANIDNTGTGTENMQMTVTDGAGTVLYSTGSNLSVGNTMYGTPRGTFNYSTSPKYNPLTFTVVSPAGNGHPGVTDYMIQGTCPGLPYLNNGTKPNFTDGRCNMEPWQTFAVYPDGDGGYQFYALYNGVGYFAMHVTSQQVKDNPDTGVNHIIAQGQGVQLYRLKGGRLEAHRIGTDNKDYYFDLDNCGVS